MSKERLLTYAYNKEKKLIHIDSVENGNNCDCICPYCNEPLCAKNKGGKKAHHFSHLSGTDCEEAYETAVHLLAKKILVENKKLRVFYDNGESETLDLEEAIPEYYDKETGLTPDIFAKSKGNILWIEFKNTHPVDENKIKTVKENAIDCIEIDISEQELDKSKLNDFLTNKLEDREWIYSKKNDEIRKKREQESLRKTQENITTLIKKMIKDKNLWLSIPVEKVSCEKRKECRIGNENCDNQKRITLNLCEHKYDKCTEKYTDEKGSTKLCLTLSRSQEKDQRDNINIILSSDGNNEKTGGEVASRTIKLKKQELENIEYILQNYKELYITDINDIIGFKIKEVHLDTLDIDVRKFIAFKSGKYYIEKVPCHSYFHDDARKSAMLSLYSKKSFNHDEEYRKLALYYCLEKKLNLRYCELCFFLSTDRGNSICIKYKKCQTPHYPMEESNIQEVINCPHFRLNKKLNLDKKDFKFIAERPMP